MLTDDGVAEVRTTSNVTFFLMDAKAYSKRASYVAKPAIHGVNWKVISPFAPVVSCVHAVDGISTKSFV